MIDLFHLLFVIQNTNNCPPLFRYFSALRALIDSFKNSWSEQIVFIKNTIDSTIPMIIFWYKISFGKSSDVKQLRTYILTMQVAVVNLLSQNRTLPTHDRCVSLQNKLPVVYHWRALISGNYLCFLRPVVRTSSEIVNLLHNLLFILG